MPLMTKVPYFLQKMPLINLTESFIEFILKDQENINNVSFVDEENYNLVFTTEYSRNFSILDNVTKFHYSRIKNSKILE